MRLTIPSPDETRRNWTVTSQVKYDTVQLLWKVHWLFLKSMRMYDIIISFPLYPMYLLKERKKELSTQTCF